MGYPMTYRRVMARNGLADGGYQDCPGYWRANANTQSIHDGNMEISRVRRERLEHLEAQGAMLVGDLRRLESDAVDEKTICKLISVQTGIDVDDVAAVLAAFMSSV